MQIKIHPEINLIRTDSWNALVHDNNPFLRHEFLSALEQHNCVGEAFGWHPCHIGVYSDEENSHENNKKEPTLLAAMPLYIKTNSYGEFVFDHAWVDAYQRSGLTYFPKIVSSIPYTPAHGQRMLCTKGEEETYYPLLLETVKQFIQDQKYSGFHCLFPNVEQQAWLKEQKLIIRHDCQFHWNNNNYNSFDDFLKTLLPKKRKNILQERKRVEHQNIQIRLLNGHDASEEDWNNFNLFYATTFAKKSGIPTMNLAFFKSIATALPDAILLVLADNEQGECVAGSLMYKSDTTLYGRHWGCREEIDKLHFEACYYQGIEYCIKHKLQLFEPGAQGEHKIARGFIPTLTRSAHWLNDSPYQEAIEEHSKHEQETILEYMDTLKSPYKEV